MSMTELANKLVDTLNNVDEDGYRALVKPQAKIWHSFDNHELSVDESLHSLQKTREIFDFTIEIQNLEELKNGFMQQHVMRLTHRQNGKTGDIFACLIATVEDGLISRIQEYIDTGKAASLMK